MGAQHDASSAQDQTETAGQTDAARELTRLVALMARLRDPDHGCPWDREQTHETIAPYAIEEAYEVLDAIQKRDWQAFPDELGDLLLQVVYQARLAEEEGHFDFATVARMITEKMIRRHPHVTFGPDVLGFSEEAAARTDSPIASRAARVGFDWPDVQGVVAKVHEEMEEFAVEMAANDRARMQDELGDVLFSIASLARRLNLDPEACLRQACDKFTRRFQAVEAHLAAEGRSMQDQPVEYLDDVWNAVKKREA